MVSTELKAIMESGPFTRAIWDFDGVVADSEPLQGKSYEMILEKYGIRPEAGFFSRYIGKNDTEIWTGLQAEYSLDADVDHLREERIAAYLEAAHRGLRPNWFVRPLMAWLAGTECQQWIVSSGNKVVVDSLLDAWGLRPNILKVFATEAGNATYSKVGVIHDLVASAPGRVIVFEDNLRYLEEAGSLGATIVAVRHELNELPTGLGDFVLDSRPEQ